MIRKFVIAAAAVATLAAGSLIVSAGSAEAKGWKGFKHFHHGHHGHFWHGHYGWRYAYFGSCLRRVWVDTPFGPRFRLINVCAY
jgi:hypothetical protein